MTDAAGISRILTLVFTDLADSTALKTQRGDQAVGELIARHRAHVRRLAAESGGRIIDWAGDGCFLTFETPSAAVLFALRLQQAHGGEPTSRASAPASTWARWANGPAPMAMPRIPESKVSPSISPPASPALPDPAQVLMSSSVADSARHRLDSDAFGQPILWRTHGSYSLKGFDEALEIREAGLAGRGSIRGAQVAADLLRGRAALLVRLHGVRRRDTRFREAPERVDGILCDAVAKVVALRVAALVGERQHGDRGGGPRGRPMRPAWLRRRPPYQYRDGDADDRGHHAHSQRLLPRPLGSRRPSRRRLFARRRAPTAAVRASRAPRREPVLDHRGVVPRERPPRRSFPSTGSRSVLPTSAPLRAATIHAQCASGTKPSTTLGHVGRTCSLV